MLRIRLFRAFLPLILSGLVPCIAASSAHPFLDTSRPIRWSALAADRLQPDVKEAIRRAHEAVDRICRTAPEEITYENTFGALEEVNVSLTEPMAKAYALKSLCDSDSIRKAMDEATPLAVAFHSSLTKNQSLWNTLKTAHVRLGDVVADPERKRYMELCMQSFRDNGADLPPGKRARLEVIDRELALCAQRFNNLYMDARKNWSWTVHDADALDGLSRTTLRQAAQEFRSRHPGETGPGWTFTLNSAAAGRVMEKVRSEKIRKDLWEHLQTLATDSYDTEPVVRQMLSLRSEKAQLCGYRTYSDYALQQSMAGNGKEAMRFVNGLLDRVKEPFFREMESLRQVKARLTENKEVSLHPWDTVYYANLQAEERFRLDREELRHYFPLPRVMAGLFGVAEQLYGIRVTELPVRKPLTGISGPEKGGEAEVWNPDVRFFAIDDGKEERLGYFYLDIFARSNKRAGAWMSPLDAGAPPAGGKPGKPRLGMICLNVQKPADGEPVLLSHREVRILFHEFGHLLHLMFSRVSIPSLAGT
ncbi:M3 family metallopeptidase, partial [Akkermansia sp.]